MADSYRWRNNAIETLLVDVVVAISNQPMIMDHIVKYYEHLLEGEFSWRSKLGLTFDVLK